MSCSDSSLPLSNCNPCAGCPPPPAVTTPCVDGEPCEELALLGCVKYSGDNISEGNIVKGERLDEILQKLLVGLTAPECVSPTLKCVTKLRSTTISASAITLAWTTALDTTSLTLQYKVADAVWTDVVVTGLSTKEITGLTAATTYYFKVSSVSSGGTNCSSVTISVTTKAV
jgi:hypothetical protein